MDPFIGEIRPFAFESAPRGWAVCAGQEVKISEYELLFALLGTSYGGDGVSTFRLPNLQGRAPIGQGQGAGLTNRDLGDTGGAATVTLVQNEMPPHSHALVGSNRAPDDNDAKDQYWGARGNLYIDTAPNPPTFMAAESLPGHGGGAPHNNLMPYLVLYYCIAVQGIYPT